ncbi:unnamed protein product [Ostreobium quekettii]|uniref:CBM20 domain-containing protein n=1 Tax=Ostreobium quekettii TaxID=121088 RepID=A0A8S1J156_9CHLO|nr:unnamed protein product [Ostreobium quekettii]|eukprot:evm.model.scf_580EXC.6 EVM.evm.TU.scf_580EXC.6   scf_580EXC:52319-54850(-)
MQSSLRRPLRHTALASSPAREGTGPLAGGVNPRGRLRMAPGGHPNPLRIHRRSVAIRCSAGSGETLVVRLSVRRRVEFGERVCVAGSAEGLGRWRRELAVGMGWSEGHVWRAECEVTKGEPFEYKYFVEHINGEPEWQPTDNLTFIAPADAISGTIVNVSDSWLGKDQTIAIEGLVGNKVDKKKANSKNIVEKQPTAEAKASVTSSRRRTVDIGAPEDAPDFVQANGNLETPDLRQGLESKGDDAGSGSCVQLY